jgi:hypothetical protein
MEPAWLKETLFAGQTANGFKLGTVLGLGWFWTKVGGCRIVYRGGSMGAIDFNNVLTVAEPDAGEIGLPDYLAHEPGQVYFYIVRSANRCGQIEQTLRAAVRVSIEASGGLEAARPNDIFEPAARQIRDGKIEIVWHYCPIEQESCPKELRVYCDEGTGEVDYQNPVTKLEYKGRRFYRYQSDQLEQGRYVFAMRAADAAGNERESMRQVSVEVSGGGVEAIGIAGVERL